MTNVSGDSSENPDPAWARALGTALRDRRPGRKRWRLDLIDGPNMSNLGKGGRDPRTYGVVTSLRALQRSVVAMAEGLGVAMNSFSSNHEGEVVGHVYELASSVDGFLINPAALTRYSAPTRIALAESGRPFIEMHFANVTALDWIGGIMTPVAAGVVMGLRHYSYIGALFGFVLALDSGAVVRPQ